MPEFIIGPYRVQATLSLLACKCLYRPKYPFGAISVNARSGHITIAECLVMRSEVGSVLAPDNF